MFWVWQKVTLSNYVKYLKINQNNFSTVFQQYANTELAHLDTQVLNVNTYLQRPMERIQTYKNVLKVW